LEDVRFDLVIRHVLKCSGKLLQYLYMNMTFKIDRLKLVFLIVTLLLMAAGCASDNSALKDESIDPAESLKEANSLIEKGYYEDARAILDKVRMHGTSLNYTYLAQLRIADSYFEEESYEEAAAEYSSFLSIHPHHKYAPYARYRLAMCYFRQIRTPDVSFSLAKKALQEFRTLQREYPRNPYMDITETRIKMCLKVMAEYEFGVGRFYFKKGSYQAAINRFNGMLKQYPDSSVEPEALYYLGLSYKELGRNDDAISVLSRLIDRFPSIERSSEARKLLASIKDMK